MCDAPLEFIHYWNVIRSRRTQLRTLVNTFVSYLPFIAPFHRPLYFYDETRIGTSLREPKEKKKKKSRKEGKKKHQPTLLYTKCSSLLQQPRQFFYRPSPGRDSENLITLTTLLLLLRFFKAPPPTPAWPESALIKGQLTRVKVSRQRFSLARSNDRYSIVSYCACKAIHRVTRRLMAPALC